MANDYDLKTILNKRFDISSMLINNTLLNDLLSKATESPRLRMNMDLRNGPDDGSQRMLNAMLPGTSVPIHRHRSSSETVVILRGSFTEIFYDDNGVECGRYELNTANGNYGLQIPKEMWHTIVVHEPTVIIETKDGAYAPTTSEDVWNYE